MPKREARTRSVTVSCRFRCAGNGASERREGFQVRGQPGEAENNCRHTQDRERASDERDGTLMPHDLPVDSTKKPDRLWLGLPYRRGSAFHRRPLARLQRHGLTLRSERFSCQRPHEDTADQFAWRKEGVALSGTRRRASRPPRRGRQSGRASGRAASADRPRCTRYQPVAVTVIGDQGVEPSDACGHDGRRQRSHPVA
jgi:hypothetical protein